MCVDIYSYMRAYIQNRLRGSFLFLFDLLSTAYSLALDSLILLGCRDE